MGRSQDYSSKEDWCPMTQLIDGKAISAQIKEEVKEKVAALKEQGREVTLAVIQVGADPASSVYVRNKKKACEYVGVRSLAYELPEETTEEGSGRCRLRLCQELELSGCERPSTVW